MALEPDGVLLDTHTWIWLRAGTLQAAPDVLAAIRSAADQQRWFVSTFTLYEIVYAISRKRLHLDRPALEWFQGAPQFGSPALLTITPEIAAATLALPAPFNGDPGDRLLAATAIIHNLTLCTHDKQLLRFSRHGHYRALKVSEGKLFNVR